VVRFELLIVNLLTLRFGGKESIFEFFIKIFSIFLETGGKSRFEKSEN